MSTTKSKKTSGKKNLLPDVIEPKDVSVRISLVIDGELLAAIKEDAGDKPYQTHMKDLIRDAIAAKDAPIGLNDLLVSLGQAQEFIKEHYAEEEAIPAKKRA